jgi:hypothetical protein
MKSHTKKMQAFLRLKKKSDSVSVSSFSHVPQVLNDARTAAAPKKAMV